MKKTIAFCLSLLILASLPYPALAYRSKKYKQRQYKITYNTTSAVQKNNAPVGGASTGTATTVVPQALSQTCSSNWYITGYFTPLESDYTGGDKTITVSGKQYSFNSAFLTEVQTEGWGKTHLGNYIGYYNNSWHFSSAPLDANDKALREDAVAIDPSLIAFGTKLSIPTLPQGLGTKTFTTSDVGPSIKGKHIDVYTGEGKAAEAMTYKITGQNNTVCTVK